MAFAWKAICFLSHRKSLEASKNIFEMASNLQLTLPDPAAAV